MTRSEVAIPSIDRDTDLVGLRVDRKFFATLSTVLVIKAGYENELDAISKAQNASGVEEAIGLRRK